MFDFLTSASRVRAVRSTFVTRGENLGASGSGAAMGRERPSEGLERLVDEILAWTRITKEDVSSQYKLKCRYNEADSSRHRSKPGPTIRTRL